MQPSHTSDTLLPRAVRRQMQGVQDRLAARSAAPAAPAAPTAPAAASPTSPIEAPAAAAPAAPVSPAPPAPSAPSPSTADARENSVDYWRNRFSVMQGVNEKLRSDHRDELAARDREVADLRSRVAQLEQGTGGPASSQSSPDIKLFFSPEHIERFGEDQCTAMAQAAIKAANDQAQRIIDAEVKPLKDAKANDDADKAKKANDAFFAKLGDLVAKIPEAGNRTIWEIDAEEAWKDFLRSEDDDGEVRQKRLDRHQFSGNAQGVANLFREYLQKSKKPTPPAPPVAPSGGGAGGDPVPTQQTHNGKGYPSAAEFNDYTKRAATIRNRNDPRYVTEKERQEMEARLRLPRPPGR